VKSDLAICPDYKEAGERLSPLYHASRTAELDVRGQPRLEIADSAPWRRGGEVVARFLVALDQIARSDSLCVRRDLSGYVAVAEARPLYLGAQHPAADDEA